MAVDFSGKWTLESSDDQYAAYVEAIAAGNQERKQRLLEGKPTIDITQTPDEIKLTFEGINYTITIHPGKEDEIALPNGTKVKGTPTWEGSKLVTRISGDKGHTHTTTREIVGGKFVQTFELDSIKTVRTFKKV